MGVFNRDLWTPDEPRVAAISIEMSQTGNIVVPHFLGKPFVEKPPLYFAVAAGSIRLIGSVVGNTGAVRLTSALWGVGALLMTFLLARRLVGRDCAVLAALILATMAGFVKHTHWIRVDAALLFFVVAAVWSLSEVYLAERPWFCLSAGLFTAGAFLSKGMIGLVFIAVAWLGLIIPWLARQRREKERLELFVLHHFLCFLTFVSLAGAWMIMFRKIGGPELWHEWFWNNHVGRLLGTASLGHKHSGKPFYYVEGVATESLPWAPLLVIWGAYCYRDLRKNRALSPSRVFLLTWSIGSILFLTMSSTKRHLYLLPLFPAFAIICADALGEGLPRWCTRLCMIWIGFCAVALLVLTMFPLVTPLLPVSASGNLDVSLQTFTLRNGFAGIGMALCLFLLVRRDRIRIGRLLVAATALLYIGTFVVLGKALNQQRSARDDIVSFVEQIPVETRPRVAAWNFSDEYMQAYFYDYENWIMPVINDVDRLRSIIERKDHQFDSVIISGVESIPELLEMPYNTLAQGRAGPYKHKRSLVWVEGIGNNR